MMDLDAKAWTPIAQSKSPSKADLSRPVGLTMESEPCVGLKGEEGPEMGAMMGDRKNREPAMLVMDFKVCVN